MNFTAREQLRAIAAIRWQLSINSLRSVRGRLNLVSRGFAGLLVIGAGIGGTSALLRFPMSYPTYFLVPLAYGALDIATALGACWSFGLFVGICVADIALFPWALLAVGGTVIFNLLLARMIFVWIEHWLS